ncbi:unnamed protein product [Discosporangium mesarthrocarpum]
MSEHDNTSSCGDAAHDAADDNHVKVVCRVRPPVARETHGGSTSSAQRCVTVGDDRRTVLLHSNKSLKEGKTFTFDYAAGENSTQEELFEEVGRPVTEACLEGYNGTIFCYGQTGSGKTFTTFGPGEVMENQQLHPKDLTSYRLRGLVPRVLEFLYDSIGRQVEQSGGRLKYACRCSFYEIFNERVFDLVDDSGRFSTTGLTVREDTKKGVYAEGLAEEEVDSAESACNILFAGFHNRRVGETAMNRESSRSHAVFTLVIEGTEVEETGLTRMRSARFNLVDLAGSERQKDTQASGERLKEASSINKSLSTLGQVFNALVERAAGRFGHVHYRDSKLTFLLRDSLGGNSKTMLVAALSPATCNLSETMSTLKFAQRAKMIRNRAVKNEDTTESFDSLQREVTYLRQRLASAQALVVPPHSGPTPGPAQPPGLPRAVDGPPGEGGGRGFAGGALVSDKLLVDALRRVGSAEAAVAGEKRRLESLSGEAERRQKEVMQLKMVIKFRDRTIEAHRKGDTDSEG